MQNFIDESLIALCAPYFDCTEDEMAIIFLFHCMHHYDIDL